MSVEAAGVVSRRGRIAVMASGSGSNFEALAVACQSGEIAADVVLMVCDRPSAAVVARAERLGIDVLALNPKEFASKSEYEAVVVEALESRGVELICLAGYMRIIGEYLLGAFEGRIINIHPSILPAFKGAKAVEQAMAYGVKYYGATIHYVTTDLDGGAIIDQEVFRYDGSDQSELEEILHRVEHPLYVRSVRGLMESLK